MSRHSSRRMALRFVCVVLSVALLAQASPFVALAYQPAADRPGTVDHFLEALVRQGDQGIIRMQDSVEQLGQRFAGRIQGVVVAVQADLGTLKKLGREAYLDMLSERLSAETRQLAGRTRAWVRRHGAEGAVRLLREAGLGTLVAQLPARPTEEQIVELVVGLMTKAVRGALQQIAGRPSGDLEKGLSGVCTVLQDTLSKSAGTASGPAAPVSTADQGTGAQSPSFWLRLCQDERLLKNFLILTIGVTAFGVAVGVAVVTGTMTPLSVIMPALVSLIALIGRG